MPRRLRMLIADDNKDFACMFQACMSANNDIEIVGIAEDGDQTCNMLEQARPDILLLDLVMPSMDGLEVLRRATTMEHRPDVIIVMSALGNDSIVRSALSLGAQDYFQKPLDIPVVLSRICSIAETAP